MQKVKKYFGYIHLWLGLTSGLVVCIVSLTGAILTFEEELEIYCVSPDLYFIEPAQTKQLSIDSLMTLASPELLKLKNGHTSSRIFLYKNPKRTAIVGYSYSDSIDGYRGHVFMNPYTGQLLGTRPGNPHNHIWQTIAELHYNLLLGDFGFFLVSWGTLFFLILLISGIVLWWPKNKSAFKQRYKFSWKDTTKWKRKNYDLHNILGFYACWIVFFMVLTGLMWSFEWFNQGVYFVTSGGQVMQTSYAESIRPEDDPNKMYPIYPSQYTQAYETFKHKYPDIYESSDEICVGYMCNDKSKSIDVSASYNPVGIRGLKAIWAEYDKTSNRITKDNFDDIKNFADEIQQSTNELHYGTYFGMSSKIATFLACMIAASLPITGFYVWWGRKNKKA